MVWQALIPALIGTFMQMLVQTLRDGGPPSVQFLFFPGSDGILQLAVYDNEDYRPPPHPTQDVEFNLFTQSNPTTRYQIFVDNDPILRSSKFSNTNPTKIIIHGFGQGARTGSFPRLVKKDFLQSGVGPFNVIYVDWEILATAPLYNTAAANTRDVGIYVAQLVNFLVRNGASLSDMHLIGFSLGAHVAGFAGKYYQKTYGKTLPRITGLDPALPSFYDDGPVHRLDSVDATFVDVIHTSGRSSVGSLGLGFDSSIGHVDFFVNGGDKQPGCRGPIQDVITACSHGRSYRYFFESLTSSSKFQAVPCSDYPKYKSGECDSSEKIAMGLFTPITSRGTYYVSTKSKAPFSYT